MDNLWITATFYVIDEMIMATGHRSHSLAQVPDSEILTVAVIATKYFQNHHQHALWVMYSLG